MAALTGDYLDDPRVDVRIEDVADAICRGDWDAIILDVDNGPDGLTRPANTMLYSKSGLEAAKRALRPGGILAVWSASADPVFRRLLEHVGFVVDEVRTRARANGKGPTHYLWFARTASSRHAPGARPSIVQSPMLQRTSRKVG